jgi:acetoin utilization protein AcuC
MPPEASDELFMKLWPRAEEFIRKSKPEFVLIQCGADSIAGDPITHMAYSRATHHHAVTSVCRIANEFCDGRVVAMGGGGYNLDNIAKTWTAVVNAMINAD